MSCIRSSQARLFCLLSCPFASGGSLSGYCYSYFFSWIIIAVWRGEAWRIITLVIRNLNPFSITVSFPNFSLLDPIDLYIMRTDPWEMEDESLDGRQLETMGFAMRTLIALATCPFPF